MIGSNYSSSYAFLNKRGMVSTHNFFLTFFFTFQCLSNLKCSVDSLCTGISNGTQMTVIACEPHVKYRTKIFLMVTRQVISKIQSS